MLVDLRLLGRFAVVDARGRSLALVGKKAKCVLAYAALTPDGVVGRERVTGLLWSNSDEGRARASLRKALMELRAAFCGVLEAAISIDRSSIRVDPQSCRVDVRELERVLADDDPAAMLRAVESTGGELLEGLDGVDAAFDEWLRIEREGLRRRIVERLIALIEEHADGADVAFAQALLHIEPANENAHRALMLHEARSGNVGAAIRRYENLRSELARELKVHPSRETERLAAAIRDGSFERGTRPTAPVAAAPRHAPAAEALRSGPPVIIVLPFEILGGDHEVAAVARGLCDDVITWLTRFRELQVISWRSSTVGSIDPRDVAGLGIQSHTRYVLRASFRRHGDIVRMNAQLAHGQADRQVWTERYDFSAKNALEVLDDVVARLTAAILPAVELDQVTAASAKSAKELAAYDCYLRAKELLYRSPDRAQAEAARDLLIEAIALDPKQFLAYGHLVRLYNTDLIGTVAGGELAAARARAYQLARQAVALEPMLTYAHVTIGWCQLWRGQFDSARLCFDRAEALNPNDPHRLTDIATAWMCLGHLDRALECMHRAMHLNPHYPEDYLADLAEIRYLRGEFDQAAQLFEAVQHVTAHRRLWRAATFARLDRRDQARSEADSFVDAVRAIWIGAQPASRAACLAWALSHEAFATTELTERLLVGLRQAGLAA